MRRIPPGSVVLNRLKLPAVNRDDEGSSPSGSAHARRLLVPPGLITHGHVGDSDPRY